MARRRMLAPINSIKHFIPRTNTQSASNVVVNLDIADAVAAPASATTTQVLEGAVLKAAHVEMWVVSGGASDTVTTVIVTVEKLPAGATPPTVTNMLNLQAYQNKKNIFYTFQGLVAASINGSNPVATIRDWILIPKGKQRFGLGDKLIISIYTLGTTLQTCGMFIYKEYR